MLNEIKIATPYIDLNTGDRVRLYINSTDGYKLYVLDEDANTWFTANMTYNPQLEATSSYWRVGTYHPAYSRELTVLTASNQLNQIYNSQVPYYQNIYTGIDTTTSPPTPTSTILYFYFINLIISKR